MQVTTSGTTPKPRTAASLTGLHCHSNTASATHRAAGRLWVLQHLGRELSLDPCCFCLGPPTGAVCACLLGWWACGTCTQAAVNMACMPDKHSILVLYKSIQSIADGHTPKFERLEPSLRNMLKSGQDSTHMIIDVRTCSCESWLICIAILASNQPCFCACMHSRPAVQVPLSLGH